MAGALQKAVVLPAWKYDEALFDREPFRQWLRGAALGSVPRLSTPPMSFRCGVFINDAYKIIFIRNRKAASSSIIKALRRALAERAQGLGRLDPAALRARGVDLDAMWRGYTVVSSVRNPWARAGSGFDFTFSRWANKQGSCRQPSFEEFCRDPMVMGVLGNMLGCATNNTNGKRRPVGDEFEHDFFHVEPAFHCLFEGGKPAVDYLVRYEKLDEDTQGMFKLLNKRLPKGLQPLTPPPVVPWVMRGAMRVPADCANASAPSGSGAGARAHGQSGGAASASDGSGTDAHDDAVACGGDEAGDALSVHAAKYRACGTQCVTNLAKFYEVDLKLMSFQAPQP